MKPILVILSAAVAAGLGCYFAFAAFGSFGLLQDRVLVNVDVFILFVAALALASSVVTVLLRSMLQRSDERLVRRLEHRIDELERRAGDHVSDVGAA
ncbi:MAG: hypothetical protein KAI24_08335 [Planctomycetes bacterium]|nr:hypothetical protein [Planctomycetota bacterium]